MQTQLSKVEKVYPLGSFSFFLRELGKRMNAFERCAVDRAATGTEYETALKAHAMLARLRR